MAVSLAVPTDMVVDATSMPAWPSPRMLPPPPVP